MFQGLEKFESVIVEYAIMLGFAAHSENARQFSFNRKKYFYTDFPKDYQISRDNESIC